MHQRSVCCGEGEGAEFEGRASCCRVQRYALPSHFAPSTRRLGAWPAYRTAVGRKFGPLEVCVCVCVCTRARVRPRVGTCVRDVLSAGEGGGFRLGA